MAIYMPSLEFSSLSVILERRRHVKYVERTAFVTVRGDFLTPIKDTPHHPHSVPGPGRGNP